MPFTDNRRSKAPPRLLVAARDMPCTAADGHLVLDATAGLWCVNAGHAPARIARAIGEQAMALDFAPSFQFGHSLGFTLALLLPGDLNRIFFANSGSVGGIAGNRKLYGTLLGGVDHLPHTHDPSRAFSRGQLKANAHLADASNASSPCTTPPPSPR